MFASIIMWVVTDSTLYPLLTISQIGAGDFKISPENFQLIPNKRTIYKGNRMGICKDNLRVKNICSCSHLFHIRHKFISHGNFTIQQGTNTNHSIVTRKTEFRCPVGVIGRGVVLSRGNVLDFQRSGFIKRKILRVRRIVTIPQRPLLGGAVRRVTKDADFFGPRLIRIGGAGPSISFTIGKVMWVVRVGNRPAFGGYREREKANKSQYRKYPGCFHQSSPPHENHQSLSFGHLGK